MRKNFVFAIVTALLLNTVSLSTWASSGFTVETKPKVGSTVYTETHSLTTPVEVATGGIFEISVAGSCSSSCADIRYLVSYSSAIEFVGTDAGSTTHNLGSRQLTIQGGTLGNGTQAFIVQFRFPAGVTPNQTTGQVRVFAGTGGVTTAYTSAIQNFVGLSDATPASSFAKTYPGVGGPVPGNYATYRVSARADRVSNRGDLNLENVQLKVNLPANSVFVPTNDAPSSGYDAQTHTYTFNLGVVPPPYDAFRFVRVSYPSQHFAVGNTVTITSQMTGNKVGQASFSPISNSLTETFRAPSGSVGFSKELPGQLSSADVRKGQAVSYGIKVSNPSDFVFRDIRVQDVIPDGVKITSVAARNNALSDSAKVFIRSQFGPNGVAQDADDNDLILIANLSSGSATTVNVYSSNLVGTGNPLPAGDLILEVVYTLPLMEFNTGPSGYDTTLYLAGTSQQAFRNGTLIPDQTLVPNTATFSATASALVDEPISASATATYRFLNPLPSLATAGIVAPAGQIQLSAPTRSFTLRASAGSNPGDAPLSDPRFILLLPEHVTLVTWSATLPNGTATPSLSALNNYNGSGGTRLLWTWSAGTVLPMGATWDIIAEVRYNLGVYATPPIDYLVGSNTEVLVCDWPWNPYRADRVGTGGFSDDRYDINLDGNTAQIYGGATTGAVTPGTTYCSRWLDVEVAPVVTADIRSKIKGAFDNSFALGPATSYTQPSSTDTLRAELFNGGTVVLDQGVIATRLSRPGQQTTKGIATNPSSQTFPLFLQSQPNIGTLSSPVTTYYSLAANPCLPEINSSPSGCSAPNWSDWSTSPPVTISAVTGLKFDFGANQLKPGQTWSIDMVVSTPSSGATEPEFAQANTTGNPLNDESAFATFATALRNQATTVALPAFESQAVTLAMPSPMGPPGYVTASPRVASGTKGVTLTHVIPLAASSSAFLISGSATVSSLSVVGEGLYEIVSSSGLITFTPDPAFVGVATPISYRVVGGTGLSATSTFTVTLVNPPASVAPAPSNPTPRPTNPGTTSPPSSAPTVAPTISPSNSHPTIPAQIAGTTVSVPVTAGPASTSIVIALPASTISAYTAVGSNRLPISGLALSVTPVSRLQLTVAGLMPGSTLNLQASSTISMQVGVGSTQVVVTSASLRGLSSIILSGQLATGQRFEISLPLKQQWAITETVYFLGDSYRLTSAAKKALLSFARLVKGKVGAVRIDVTGFVRRTSNTSYDQRLSRLRAEGIVRELRRLGVVARYSVTAAGIAKENSPVARRAEIYGYSW